VDARFPTHPVYVVERVPLVVRNSKIDQDAAIKLRLAWRQLAELGLRAGVLMIRKQAQEPCVSVEAARGSSLQLRSSAKRSLLCRRGLGFGRGRLRHCQLYAKKRPNAG